MTSVQRPYINIQYEQAVDDGCLEYKSIPMAIVKDLVKVSHATNEYDGIKQIYNLIPPRPKNINAMATTIARMNNLPYSAVDGIAKKIIDEEKVETRRFVANAPAEPEPEMLYEPYVPEQPTRSSTGVRLAPEEIATSRGTQTYFRKSAGVMNTQTDTHQMADGTTMTNTDMVSTGTQMVNIYPTKTQNRNMSVLKGVSLILGELYPSSGVVPFNTSVESQTEWTASREKGFSQVSSRKFGELAGGFAGLYESGDAFTQTNLSKPSTFKNFPPNAKGYSSTSFPPFFIGNEPEQRKGTFDGTPTRHLPREQKTQRIAESMGEHFQKRLPFTGDSATSGYTTPLK